MLEHITRCVFVFLFSSSPLMADPSLYGHWVDSIDDSAWQMKASFDSTGVFVVSRQTRKPISPSITIWYAGGWKTEKQTLFYLATKTGMTLNGRPILNKPLAKDHLRSMSYQIKGGILALEKFFVWDTPAALRRASKGERQSFKIRSETHKIPFITRKSGAGAPDIRAAFYATLLRVISNEHTTRASRNEGNVVLDPFCGCATTLVAADRLQRQWVGIDLSTKAGDLVRERIEADQGHLFKDIQVRNDIPKRTDLGPPLTAAQKRKHKTTLYGLQTGLCNGCNQHFRVENFHMDHIVARARGGTDHSWNFQLLCGHCNSLKGKKTQAEFASIISEKRKDFSWL